MLKSAFVIFLIFTLHSCKVSHDGNKWVEPHYYGDTLYESVIQIKGDTVDVKYYQVDVEGYLKSSMKLVVVDSVWFPEDSLKRKIYIGQNLTDHLYYPLGFYKMKDGNLRFQLTAGCTELIYGFSSRVEMDTLYLLNEEMRNACVAMQTSGNLFLSERNYGEFAKLPTLKIESKEQFLALYEEEKIFIRDLINSEPTFGARKELQIHELFFLNKGFKYWQASSEYMNAVFQYEKGKELNLYIYQLGVERMKRK